jgi:hypothetical protein
MTTSPGLFDEVVAASGLAELIAPFTVSRLLVAADVQPTELTSEGLVQAMPHLERGLSVYLSPDELDEALGKLRALADR